MQKYKRINTAVIASVVIFGLLALPVSLWADSASQAAQLWKQMRAKDVNSTEFSQAREKLLSLIGSLPASQKVPVATALMQRGSDDATNATALDLFGPDGLPLGYVRALVDNPKRSWPQRVLVRTYYKFCHPEYETRLSEAGRRKLLAILSERLTALSDQPSVSYGEQRLLHHMMEAVLCRYAGKQGSVPELAQLLMAMRAYADSKPRGDVLALSLKAWAAMNDSSAPPINSERTAMLALGHWDPLIRTKAASYLGAFIRKDPTAGPRVLAMLKDPRDEVRSAAASVFNFALSYSPEEIVEAMVMLLADDRSVPVQRAAAETLIAHSEEAQTSINLLLAVLNRKTNRPGPKRTTSILETLSYLIHDRTARSQKQGLLDAAVDNLDRAPAGALQALEALGPYAKPALPVIKRYRDTKADRFTRQKIDRHVLQAIGS